MNINKWLWKPVEVPQSKRLLFVDALRGVLVILVVCFHFETDWVVQIPDTPSRVLRFFRMPAFFFIMGYLSAICFGGVESLKHKLRRRLEVQLIPTILFMVIFALIFSRDILYIFTDVEKGGFWFTWGAVVVMMVYSALWMVSQKVTKSHFLQVLFVVAGGIMVYKLQLMFPLPKFMNGVLTFSKSMIFITYFMVGVLCREYSGYFYALLGRKWIVFILLAVGVAGVVAGENWPLWDKVYILAAIFGVFGVFYHLNPVIERSRLGRFLTEIGRYTLEIYLVHSLMLGWHPENRHWIPDEWPFWAQVSVRMACATALSIAIYLVVCRLPFRVKRVLFGRRRSSNQKLLA